MDEGSRREDGERREGVQVTRIEREMQMRQDRAVKILKGIMTGGYNEMEKEEALLMWDDHVSIREKMNKFDTRSVLQYVIRAYVRKEAR